MMRHSNSSDDSSPRSQLRVGIATGMSLAIQTRPDARIDDGVDDVHREVDDDDKQRETPPPRPG